jgi:hypothetical protein
MFSTDFPHIDHSWPKTEAWLQVAINDIPVEDAERFLESTPFGPTNSTKPSYGPSPIRSVPKCNR